MVKLSAVPGGVERNTNALAGTPQTKEEEPGIVKIFRPKRGRHRIPRPVLEQILTQDTAYLGRFVYDEIANVILIDGIEILRLI